MTPVESVTQVGGADIGVRQETTPMKGKLSLDLQFIGPLLTASFVTLAFVRIPRRPSSTDVDSSWCAVLDYARQHGLQFGHDLAFPYGPLGFVIMPVCSPWVGALQLALGSALCFIIVTGLCLVAWRLTPLWRYLCIAVFSFLALNMHSSADLLLSIGLLSWGLLCLVETGPRLLVWLVCFTMLAIVGAIAKISFLLAAILSVGAIGVDLAFRRQFLLAFAMPGLFCAGLLSGWVVAGQKLSYFLPFAAFGWAFSTGYDQAMGKQSSNMLGWCGPLVLALAAAMIVLRSLASFGKSPQAIRWRKLILLGWLVASLFLAWKQGFVRLDALHIELFLGFAVMLALLLEVLSCETARTRSWVRSIAIACCLISLSMLGLYFDAGPLDYFIFRPYQQLVLNLRHMAHPVNSFREPAESEKSQERLAALPKFKAIIGSARADVFGNGQAYAILNNLNYQPRPVFQSYAAYSGKLMRLNEQFYSSSRAPDFILFNLAPIDHRFPPLEDSLLLRDLLSNCELVGREGRFLLLKLADFSIPRLKLLREDIVAPGTPIGLEKYGRANIWMEISLAPTIAGKIRQLSYKSSELRLTAWRGPSKTKATFHSPAPMMAAGFLASPLLLRNEDVLAFYQGRDLTRPKAYSVETIPEKECFWQQEVHFRIYQIESSFPRFLKTLD